MQQYLNPNNSHVFNTLAFNAGQFRDCTVGIDVIESNSFSSIYPIKYIFNTINVEVESLLSNIKSIRVKNLSTFLFISSDISCLAEISKLKKIFLSLTEISSSSSVLPTYVRLKNNTLTIPANTSVTSGISNIRGPFVNITDSSTSVSCGINRNSYTALHCNTTSSFDINYSGFLLYYKGKLKVFICPKSSPHHPGELKYRVRGNEIKKFLPLNSSTINSSYYNEGEYTTASYHFDTAETVKDNTSLNICTQKEPAVIKCSDKPLFFF